MYSQIIKLIVQYIQEIAFRIHEQMFKEGQRKVDLIIDEDVQFTFEKVQLDNGLISFTCFIADRDGKDIGKYTLEPTSSVSKYDVEKAIRYAIFDNNYRYDKLQVHTILSICNDGRIDVNVGALITPSDVEADINKLSNKATLKVLVDMIDDKSIGNLVRATEESFTSNDWTIVLEFEDIWMVFESFLHVSPPPYVRTTECLICIGSTDHQVAKVSFNDTIPVDSGKESSVYLSKLYGALARSAMDMAKNVYDFDIVDSCIRVNTEHGMKQYSVNDDNKSEFLTTRFE